MVLRRLQVHSRFFTIFAPRALLAATFNLKACHNVNPGSQCHLRGPSNQPTTSPSKSFFSCAASQLLLWRALRTKDTTRSTCKHLPRSTSLRCSRDMGIHDDLLPDLLPQPLIERGRLLAANRPLICRTPIHILYWGHTEMVLSYRLHCGGKSLDHCLHHRFHYRQ